MITLRFTPLAPAAILMAVGLIGCTLDNAPPPPTAFLTSTGSDLSASMSRLPFDHAWRAPEIDFSRYTHIAVRPVTTDYLNDEFWADSQSPFIPDQKAYDRQVTELAKYWTRSLKQQFSSPICSFYLTGNSSRPHTLVLEIAITRASFARPADRARKTPITNPALAFEARFKDSASGRVLATASDVYGLPFKIENFTAESFNLSNREICDDWSLQLMQATNRELFPKVRR